MPTSHLKKIVPLILAVILLFGVGTEGTVSQAAEMPDLTRNGSISVTMQDSDNKEAISGGTLTLYQAGTVKVENGFSFVLTEAFEGSRQDLTELSADLAENLASYAQTENIDGQSVSVGENGIALFEDLKPGLYLIVQTEAADGFQAVSPFLVSIPENNGDGYIYDVDATPKMSAVSPVPSEPSDSADTPKPAQSKPTGTLPQTGQLNWPVPVLTLCGLLIFTVGWRLYFSKRGEHHAS